MAAELARRAYVVSLTLGNAPWDMLAVSPNGKEFKVEVKGVTNRNFWVIRKWEQQDDNLYYFLVSVPSDTESKPRYFILTSEEVRTEVKKYLEGSTATSPNNTPGISFSQSFEQDHVERQWEKLPL